MNDQIRQILEGVKSGQIPVESECLPEIRYTYRYILYRAAER